MANVKLAMEYAAKIDRAAMEKRLHEWVGLTDEDMKDPKTHNFDFINGARWAETNLKDKNT